MDNPLNKRYILIILVLMLIAVFACNGPATPTTPSIDTPTPIDTGKVLIDIQVRRELPIVWAGPGDVSPLPRLRDGDWQDLAADGKVTTDQDGEAWLDISDCLRIYLFQDSQLVKAACPKSTYTGGNVTCSLAGTGVYNNACSSQVVLQTLSADVMLEGIWVMLTYLPKLQLTVVVVAEGEADVWPVIDFDSRETTDRPITVHSQELLFTSPDDKLHDIAGLPPRVPLPLVVVYLLVEELGLEKWLDRTVGRADRDDVPFPQPDEIEQEQAFVVQGAGGPLADPQIAQALSHAVDWRTILDELYPGTQPYVALSFPELQLASDQLDYNPDLAKNLMRQAGVDKGIKAALLVSPDDKRYIEAAEQIAKYLSELGTELEVRPQSTSSAPVVAESYLRGGVPVLWLGAEEIDLPDVFIGPTPTPSITTMSFQDGVSPADGYTGMEDATIAEANASTNYGNAVDLLVDGDDPGGSGKDLSSLMRWDISAIPMGSIVQSASIELNVFNSTGSQVYELYEVLRPWVEDEVTWNDASNDNSWETSGALGASDHDPEVLGSLGTSSKGVFSIPLNDYGVAAVQRWVDKPSVNYGLIMANSSNNDGMDFDSSDAGTATLRLKLIITYQEPVAMPNDTPTHTPTPTPLCTVVSSGLNLRSGPGTVFAPQLATLRRGTELIPLYRNRNASWIYVRVQSKKQQGWVIAGNRYLNCNRNIRQLSPTVEPPTPTPAPTISFSNDRTSIREGECTNLRWDVNYVRAVTLDGQPVNRRDVRRVCPRKTTSYVLSVDTGVRTVQREVTIRVTPAPVPTIEITPPSASIKAGECVTLRWNIHNVRAVYLDGGGVVGVSSRRVCPTSTRTYTFRIVTDSGDMYRNVKISVTTPPKFTNLQFHATLDKPKTRPVTLTWSASGGSSPYKGTITARYSDSSALYATYSVSSRSGQITDNPGGRCRTSTIIYTLTLEDRSGQRLVASDSVQVSFIC